MGKAIDPALLAQVLAFDQALQERRPEGLLDAIPAYASVLCRYDPAITTAERLEKGIRQLEGRLRSSPSFGPIVEIPTTYDGPDLGDVAAKTDLSTTAVIELHSGREYLVYCVGFAPVVTAFCPNACTACGLPSWKSFATPRQCQPRAYLVGKAPGSISRMPTALVSVFTSHLQWSLIRTRYSFGRRWRNEGCPGHGILALGYI